MLHCFGEHLATLAQNITEAEAGNLYNKVNEPSQTNTDLELRLQHLTDA